MNKNIHNNNNSLILSHKRQKKIGKRVGIISPELHSGEAIFSISLFMHIK